MKKLRMSKDIEIPKLTKYGDYQKEGVAFDIETTNFTKNDRNLATMYIWQLAIDDLVIYGRTWEEFTYFIEEFSKKNEKINILIYVHNLSFEFQFIKTLFNWNISKNGVEVFSKDGRSIIYAKYKNIEFRDSLSLTNMPLASFAKNYKLETEKLVGNLDYDKLRHSKTELTKEELDYCFNDVLILTEWYKKYILPEFLDKKIKIPLTSTGIVRAELEHNFEEFYTKEEQKEYKKKIAKCQPKEDIYLLFRQFLFRGGLTHANTSACNEVLENVASYDLKSAHPSQMLTRKYPYRFYRENKKKWEDIYNNKDLALFGCFKFHNIRCKGWHCLESKNKIIKFSDDAVFENGRLAYASEMEVLLNEIDLDNYNKMYTWDKIECEYIYSSKKDYLPEFLRKTVIYYFGLKETLPKDTLEYTLAKRKLNSLFGCCSTGINIDTLNFNPEKNTFEVLKGSKTYKNEIKGQILLPQWAIWIASYTRSDIVEILDKTGIDSIYYDTDSDKIKHPEKYTQIIEDFNNKKREMNKLINTYEYDKKIVKNIGTFEHEYDTNKLKVLGAKRYIVNHDGKDDVVVAGMAKGSLQNYAEKTGQNIYELFTDGLMLTREYSNKKTAIYCDESFTETLTDYTGQTETVKEGSCVAIISIPFKMNVVNDFLEMIKRRKEERQNEIYQSAL